eukprot:765583-Amphidinium_carterae.1
MSGRYTCVAAFKSKLTQWVIREACTRLALPFRGSEQLLQGTNAVPAQLVVQHWRGVAPVGEITEYQLIV